MEPLENTGELIKLSSFTAALIENFKRIKSKRKPDEMSRINVSQTASFFAIAYERVRNVVEYRENHLIRRAAIERILKRRLILNPEGAGEGENLIRELLWARYFSADTLGQDDVNNIQQMTDLYLGLMKTHKSHSEFFFHLLTCEVEELLSPQEAQKNTLKMFYIYQVLKEKVKVEHVEDELKNIYFYIALEKIFSKSDLPYLRYHLFKLLGKEVLSLTTHEIVKIDNYIRNPYSDRFRRFIQSQIPPFKILFEVVDSNPDSITKLLQSRENLLKTVEQICNIKYFQTSKRLRSLAVKAIIYIFLTKMLLALILEYPLSLYIFNEVNYFSLAINTIFPPVLMFLIVGITKVPRHDNTSRIYDRVIDIVDVDKSFETTVSFIRKQARVRRPTLIFIFTIIYSLTFFITFFLLYELLSQLRFNLISQLIFVFFVSLVAYFAYRIRQVAKEYKLQEKESILRPFSDFFFIPILALGKFLSGSIARLNFITAFLDFLIEAPFKLIIEVVEEWINFIRARREEIV